MKRYATILAYLAHKITNRNPGSAKNWKFQNSESLTVICLSLLILVWNYTVNWFCICIFWKNFWVAIKSPLGHFLFHPFSFVTASQLPLAALYPATLLKNCLLYPATSVADGCWDRTLVLEQLLLSSCTPAFYWYEQIIWSLIYMTGRNIPADFCILFCFQL